MDKGLRDTPRWGRAGAERLLMLYRDPAGAAALKDAAWQGILGSARRSRTLGHLAHRLWMSNAAGTVPPRIARQIDSLSVLIRRRRAQLRWELDSLAHALADAEGDVVLLKGAAYETLNVPLARARLVSDVDLLVRAADVARVERKLLAAGWAPRAMNAYDDRYYREWSHELPPFVHPDRGVEVDVHHSITPSMRGRGVDADELIDASVVIEFDGHRRFRVLQPVDQLVHCALHTFKDSDLSLRLRESMDFDLLYRHYVELNPDLPVQLIARAQELKQTRPLWWAIHFARRWLGSPIPAWTLDRLRAPSPGAVRVMSWLCDRAMLPGERMERTGIDRLAAIVLLARYHYQRLPLIKLIPHVLEKSKRRLLQSREQPDAP